MSVDEILTEFDRGRKSMETQVVTINAISEKFNSVLLQLESCTLKSSQSIDCEKNMTPYAYSEGVKIAFTQIIEQFKHMVQKEADVNITITKPSEDVFILEDYVEKTKERAKFLCSCVRKLLALQNTIVQMKADLLKITTEELDYEELAISESNE